MSAEVLAILGTNAAIWATVAMLYRSMGKLEGTVETEIKRLHQRIDQQEKHVDQRIDTLEKHIDHRFDRIEQRFDDLLKAKVLVP